MTGKFKVACLGPSGSGKTTMANFIAETYGIPFIPNSAGIIIPERIKEHLRSTYRWKEAGHKEVIRLSNEFPSFGQSFQEALLAARGSLITTTPEFVIDRSPIDNVAYMLAQCAHLVDEEWVTSFISEAKNYAKEITHFIIFPSLAPEIEDNGSRVNNKYYQRMSTAIFEHTYMEYFKDIMINKTLMLDTWDLDVKKDRVLSFLK